MPGSPFLRTRVARRILLLFLLCAVLPLALLAVLGYGRLADDLDEVTRTHLRDQAKASGMMLLDRLNLLASVLETIGTEVGPAGAHLPEIGSINTTGPRFRSIGIVDSGRAVTNLLGKLPDLPALNDAQEQHVSGGGVALVSGPGPRGLRLYLVRRLGRRPEARIWGFIERNSVYGGDPSTSVAPAGSLFCLRSELNEDLSCPVAEASAPRGAQTWHWRDRKASYVAAQWTLFLNRVFAAPAWVVSLSVSDAVVTAPLVALRRAFLLGLVLALLVVFTLAHIQLRRSMEPLEALEEGTRRLAAGRFHEPVTVQSDDEFQALAQSFNRMAGELGTQFEHQRSLARVHDAALGATGTEVVLRTVLAERQTLLPGTLTVALADPDDLERWSVIGDRGAPDGPVAVDLRPDAADLEALRRIADATLLEPGQARPSYTGDRAGPLDRHLLILPLRWRGTLTGALIIDGNVSELQQPGTLLKARQTADEIALALANAQMVTQLDELNWGALTALARAIDAVSPWTAGHSERVTLGAVEIGRRLGLSADDTDLLHRGGLLHDVGKVGVPAAILDKPGSLTPEELAQIRRHPSIGARILAPITAFRRAIPLVLSHHELLDGSGYPHGLKGEQIPLIVRVLTVADVFDALVSDRPYRAAWEVDRAVGYLRENIDTKFDRRAVDALEAALRTGWRPAASGISLLTDEPARLALWPAATRS
ncbi:MAG: HD domain-containing protein [Gemmatimonadales bacterium]